MPRKKLRVDRTTVLEKLTGFEGRSFFTSTEAAALLSCSAKTIHNMVKDARITPMTIGTRSFYSREEILAFAGIDHDSSSPRRQSLQYSLRPKTSDAADGPVQVY